MSESRFLDLEVPPFACYLSVKHQIKIRLASASDPLVSQDMAEGDRGEGGLQKKAAEWQQRGRKGTL